MTQEERIKNLEQRLELVIADNDALLVDLQHYKRVAAGQKGRLKQMSQELEKTKIDINAKNKTIAGLESQVHDMSKTTKQQACRIEQLKGDLAVAEANLEYYKSLPWWRKIFI